jgi:radical SAM protein with 4Fe4S-binding SPASM domain
MENRKKTTHTPGDQKRKKLVRKAPNYLNDFRFSLQWHITAKCDCHCKHCYMYDSPFYANEIKNELSLDQCKLIVDDLAQTVTRWGIKGFVAVTGGDPLLCDHLYGLLAYIKQYPMLDAGIMGNSYHVNEETAKQLKDYDVTFYQISLDGLEKTHDHLRQPGSFKDAIRAYRVLKECGVRPCCMYTVSKLNADEICDLIRFLTTKRLVGAFGFDRLVPTGTGKELKESLLSAQEYRRLLLEIEDTYQEILNREEGTRFELGHKDNLWNLAFSELGQLEPAPELPAGCDVHTGCLIGWQGMSVLADGTVLACRRLPIAVGKLPEQNISEIWVESERLNELRQDQRIEKCGECELRSRCRGCRAVAHAMSGGNYFARDEYCWKE